MALKRYISFHAHWTRRSFLKSIAPLRIFPIIVSLVLFLISFLFESHQVTSIGQNGLSQIQLPYSSYAFLVMMTATGFMLFALCFNIAFRGRVVILRRAIIGTALTSFGFTVLLFSGLVLLLLDADYAVRCAITCDQTLIHSHLQEIQFLSINVALGVVLAGLGLWLMIRTISSQRALSKTEVISIPRKS